jgi:hypothetical protein
MSSISSQMISQVTLFRNPNGCEQEWVNTFPRDRANPLKIALAEVGYIAIVPFAIVEAVLSVIAKAFSSILPIGKERHEAMSNWMKSSAFSVAWTLCDAVINVICNDLIVTEKVARACAASGNFFNVPQEAL